MEFAGENQKGETCLEGKTEEKSLEERRLKISRKSSLSLQWKLPEPEGRSLNDHIGQRLVSITTSQTGKPHY